MMFVRPIPNSRQARLAVTEPARVAMVERIFLDAGLGRLRHIEQLAVGGQAHLLEVRRSEGESLVVKCFNPAMPHAADAFVDAYDSLHRVHDSLDGKQFGGWTVRAPKPLHRSERDLAIVMTRAPGESVHSWLRREPFDNPTMQAVAPVIASAMWHFWSSTGRQYGDINLHNLLIDPEPRALWLLDSGIPAPRWTCPNVADRWAPASRDLGYLLYYAASNVRAMLGQRSLRRRQQWMSRQIVSECALSLPAADRRDFLSEIASCAQVHVDAIATSATPGGLWRGFVRRQADRWLRRTTNELARQRAGEALP